MYCSTCGAYVAAGRTECAACGSRVATPPAAEPKPPTRYGPEDGRWVRERSVGVCPRCSYKGEGVGYFSRGMHAAGLVGITVLTAGAMGIGGIVYYLIRREHRVCPRCGQGWGRFGERSLVPVRGGAVERPQRSLPGSGRETTKRGFSILMWVFAVIMLIVGVAEAELIPFLFGVASGAGGWMLQRSANVDREARRAALISEMQLAVLRLAGERGGRLTVTEVAAALAWPMRRAEKVLNSLDDGLRVNSDVTDDGIIVYEFLELLRAPVRRRELGGGGDSESPRAQA